MKLLYISIWKKQDGKDPILLSSEREMESVSRFVRTTVTEYMHLFAEKSAKGTPVGVRQALTDGENMPKHKFHTYSRSEDICGVLLTDLDYPEQTAQSILSKITNEFVAKYPKSAYSDPKRVKAADPAPLPFPELKEYIVKYQDPHQADPLLKIQSELNETKTILHHTIEDMLERGEKIDNLVAKSDVLSSQSKMFYTQAKKQNSCCSVM